MVMKKIFIVAGEASGDILGGWYLRKLRQQQSDIMCHAIGGDQLAAAGATLHAPLTDLNIVGIIEIIKHIPYIFSYLKRLADHICAQQYDEIILVDFPGFNMRLGQMLKKRDKNIKITYLSPPQMWAWGAWRLKKLKRISDQLLVIYPFEVEWYAKRGVKVEWVGCPTYDRLTPYFANAQNKQPKIAMLPASRTSELATLLPIMAKVIKQFKLMHPEVVIVVPIAGSLAKEEVERKLHELGVGDWGQEVRFLVGHDVIMRELSTCCMAVTKPGTITLELALLKVPSFVVYKTSWFSYFIARLLVGISYMALPNLLLKDPVFPEFIQGDCRSDTIVAAMNKLYLTYKKNKEGYNKQLEQLAKVRELFKV